MKSVSKTHLVVTVFLWIPEYKDDGIDWCRNVYTAFIQTNKKYLW